MKIEIKKRIGKRFPYYYDHNATKEMSNWEFTRTFYFFRWAIVIHWGVNK